MNHYDPTDTRAQDKTKAELDEEARRLSRQETDDFKWLMSDKRGRRIVWGLLERTGIYRSSFTGNSETFFREGARNVGLVYLDLLNTYTPEKYNLMVTEQRHNDRQRNDNDRRK